MKNKRQGVILTYTDINEEYTSVVAGYLRRGYIINTATFNGHEDEIAHIDVTDGKKVVRILLKEFFEKEGYECLSGIKVFAGRVPDCENIVPNSNDCGQIVWNKRLEEITCDRYYLITHFGHRVKWMFGSRDDAIHAEKLRSERSSINAKNKDRQFTSDVAIDVAARYLKRNLKKNRIAKNEIQVFRGTCYYVLYKGLRYYMH